MLSLIITVVFLFLVWKTWSWYHEGRQLPPGPPNFPIIGSLPYILKKRLYEYASELEEVHNHPGLITFRVNNRIIIFANKWAIVKELFINRSELTSDRPYQVVPDVINRELYGIVNAPRPKWEYARRFSLRVLRDFGVGKSKIIDRLILTQVQHIEEAFEDQLGVPMDPAPILHRAVAGVICSLLFGQPADHQDKKFDTYLHDANQFLTANFRWLVFVPVLRFLYRVRSLLPWLPDGSAFIGYWRVMEFLQEKVDEHRNHFSDAVELTDFVDAYLAVQKNPRLYNLEDTNIDLNDLNLRQIIFELFVAGTDTTYVSLLWGVLFLSEYQDIQERMHKEIHDLVGYDRLIDFVNASSLHYTRAVVYEVLRFGNVAGLSLPHAASAEIHIGGYRIPKDCTVFVNITHCLREKMNWKNPNQFDPENFLNENGEFTLNDAFVAFSLGRRVCPGESLARNEAFVFLASIVQKYRIKLEPGVKFESLLQDAKIGPIRSPKKYKILVERRE